MYKVIGTLKVKNNTAVTIEGEGVGLRNNIYVTNEREEKFHLLSVGMTNFKEPEKNKITNLLIEGEFNGKYIYY